MSKLVIIDNYDSFTYNLVHAIEEILGTPVDVVKNDLDHIDDLDQYEYFILSPGPGLPVDSGKLMEIIERYKSTKKILGVCLGLQAIAESYGCQLKNLSTVFHGIRDKMIQTENTSILYEGIEKEFFAGRYHSWVIEKSTLLPEFEITSIDSNEEIMSIQHKTDKIHAVQFHPESIMTDQGKRMLENFISKA